ncbi:MAG TPA: hypothetical protein VFI24_02500 [Pyrinomonadaceae bacterium]|nr:hypothetical protein [Pyrinomonadaceae bacterium]
MKQEPRSEHDGAVAALPFEQKCYEEIIDFFARGASPEEILSFHPSQETQERVRELLELNSADELTEEEAAELEFFGQVEHLMQSVKVRVHENIKKKT